MVTGEFAPFAKRLKTKGSKPDHQVYRRVSCLSRGFWQAGSDCVESGQQWLPILVLHPFL